MPKINKTKTDWDEYYKNPYKVASITRKITGNILVGVMKKYSGTNLPLRIIEIGGGNSCFYELILNNFDVKEYHILDNNELSLEILKNKKNISDKIFTHNVDILKKGSVSLEKADIVYSVGLIEHFNKIETEKVIEAHFNMAKEGGLVIITFPTPTFLYRIIRKIMEIFNIWIFYDERPLEISEVSNVCEKRGRILFKKIIWPILLTQGLIVARPSSAQKY